MLQAGDELGLAKATATRLLDSQLERIEAFADSLYDEIQSENENLVMTQSGLGPTMGGNLLGGCARHRPPAIGHAFTELRIHQAAVFQQNKPVLARQIEHLWSPQHAARVIAFQNREQKTRGRPPRSRIREKCRPAAR